MKWGGGKSKSEEDILSRFGLIQTQIRRLEEVLFLQNNCSDIWISEGGMLERVRISIKNGKGWAGRATRTIVQSTVNGGIDGAISDDSNFEDGLTNGAILGTVQVGVTSTFSLMNQIRNHGSERYTVNGRNVKTPYRDEYGRPKVTVFQHLKKAANQASSWLAGVDYPAAHYNYYHAVTMYVTKRMLSMPGLEYEKQTHEVVR